MKKITIYMFMASAIFCQNLNAAFFGNVNVNSISTDNVYEDYSGLSDSGLFVSGGLNYTGKLTKTTFPGLNYYFTYIAFPDIDLENEYDNFVSGALKQRLGRFADLDFAGGFDSYSLPNSKLYSSYSAYAKPALNLYPFTHTEVDLGYIYEDVSYPDYDLDNIGRGYFAAIYLDMPFDSLAVIKGRSIVRDYTDRALYSQAAVVSNIAREDKEYESSAVLRKYLSRFGRVEAGYVYYALDSNANELDASDNVVNDYWDYNSRRYSLRYTSGIFKKFTADLLGFYQTKEYRGWPARAEDGGLNPNNELRSDELYGAYIEIKREIFTGMFASGSYTVKDNRSNDYYYDASTNMFSIGLQYYF